MENLKQDLSPLPYPTPDAAAIDLEVRELAALCVLTAREAEVRTRLGERHPDGAAYVAGDPWPFRHEDEGAPAGSSGWWHYAATVLAVAHNTRIITTVARNAVLDDAYLVALARGGVR